jgi:hypothetical protein
LRLEIAGCLLRRVLVNRNYWDHLPDSITSIGYTVGKSQDLMWLIVDNLQVLWNHRLQIRDESTICITFSRIHIIHVPLTQTKGR